MGLLSGPPVTFSVEGVPESVCSGAQISGKVHMQVNKDEGVKARRLFVKLMGEEHCAWTEGSGDSRRHFKGHRVIVDQTVQLWSEGERVPGGAHSYPFEFAPLPADAPGSLVLPQGTITYRVHVCLDIAMGKDGMFDQQFTVVPSPAVLQAAASSLPTEVNTSVSASCLFMGSGTVETRAVLTSPSLVVGPGTPLSIRVSVNNASSRELERGHALLVCLRTYRASSRTRVDREVLGRVPISEGFPMQPSASGNFDVDLSGLVGNGKMSVTGQVVSLEHFVDVEIPIAMCKDLHLPLTVLFSPDGAAAVADSIGAAPAAAVPASAPPVPAQQAAVVSAPARHAAVQGDAAFEELIAKLDGYDDNKEGTAADWLSAHPSANPSPDQLARAVGKVFSLKQVDFVRAVAPKLNNLTCAHAAAVLQLMSFSGKKESLQAMAPYLRDKAQNKHLILDTAGMLDRGDYEQILN